MKSTFGILGAVSALCMLVSASAFAYGGYSAIIYNTADGTWGSSWSNDQVTTDGTTDSFDRASAETMAIASCNANPTDANTCNVTVADVEARPYTTKIIETYSHNGWVALATGPNNAYGTSGCNSQATANCHDNEADAENSAVQACNAKAGANAQCKVVRSFASLSNTFDVDGVEPPAQP